MIQRGTDFLAKKGVGSPRLQAELLLAHVLRMPRMKLYLSFERDLAPPEIDALRLLLQRRGQREPLQYIIGSTSFCGLEIAVNKNVLIPRPETEFLAERGWKFLLARPGVPAALDLGTGSGCLAVALAANAPAARVAAVDVSNGALETARANARQNNVAERIDFFHGNMFDALPTGMKFDLIISNPPYIPTARIATLETEVRDFEPRGALDGGADGLDFYRLLAERAAEFLAPGGELLLELDDEGAERARGLFLANGWSAEPVERDDAHRPRILVAHRGDKPHDGPIQIRS